MLKKASLFRTENSAVVIIAAVLPLTLLLTASVNAQSTTRPATQPRQTAQPAQITAPDSAAQTGLPAVVQKVGFRLANWRTLHGDGSPASDELVQTLKTIGCEVRESNHGGHTDISYRSPSWKTIDIQNDDQSAQWQTWLVDNEFETVVLNPPVESQLPTVQLRMQEWKTQHAQNPQQAADLRGTYELIGCETLVDNHGDHSDVRFRCPNGSTLGFPNAQAAHIWQQWLDQTGFETLHDHSHDDHDAHAGHDHAAHDHAGHGHEH